MALSKDSHVAVAIPLVELGRITEQVLSLKEAGQAPDILERVGKVFAKLLPAWPHMAGLVHPGLSPG